MGKIFVLIGKSASGKDTAYARLISDDDLKLAPYVIYTTRPMREGETDGVEYHFSDEAALNEFKRQGRLVESRVYHTVYGDWYYFTVDDENIDLENKDYLYIGTLESFVQMCDHFGKEKVIPLYLEVDDGLRLERALGRERQRQNPGYAEMCRRFLGDADDFSEEKIIAAGIEKRFDNTDADTCYRQLASEIKSYRV